MGVQQISAWQVISALICLGLFAVSGDLCQAAERVGTVILAKGGISARGEDGQIRILGKGAPVFEKDKITTAAKSYVVITFVDGARITLRPESDINLQAYKYAGTKDDNSTLELVKGGFRALSGFIGTNNPDAYRVRSPLGNLGIRGTRYLTRLCQVIGPDHQTDCQTGDDLRDVESDEEKKELIYENVRPGQYTSVQEGVVWTSNGVDTIEISPGEAGFMDEQELLILPQDPPFVPGDQTPDPVDVDDETWELRKLECAV